MKHFITTAIAVCLLALTAAAQTTTSSIGTWKAYMAYHDITRIVRNAGMAYVLASGDLYTYNTADQSVDAYDKVNALSDCNISDIEWNAATRKLLILYSNTNIDLMDEKGNVVNLPDYYNKLLTMDKTVNSITSVGARVYMATGFGVVVVNMENATIADTYNLGTNVTHVAHDGRYIYAATTNGVYKGDTRDNLANKATWKQLTTETFSYVFWNNGTLIGAKSGNLSYIDTDTGSTERKWTPWSTKFTLTGGKVVGYSGSHTYVFTSPTDRLDLPRQFRAIARDAADDSWWANDTDGTLMHFTIGSDKTITTLTTGIRPDGPKYNYFGFMRYMNGKLYTGGGQSSPEREACIQILDGGNWDIYDDSFASSLKGTYHSTYVIDLDPSDPSHVYAGTQAGLFEFRDGKMTQHYDIDNSPLVTASPGDPYSYTLVTALKARADGSVWCFNSNANNGQVSLLELNGGEWTSHHSSSYVDNEGKSMQDVHTMIEDSRHLLWWTNNDWRLPALVCYNPATGDTKVYDTFVNEDGTRVEAGEVGCVVEDRQGNLWVGTSGGPVMLTSDEIASGGETFTQVKVPRNDGTNLADYLLANVYITSICIDGAGRKWFGTSGNGVYLISADNLEQIEHFTKSNSMLLSDNVESVAVNDATGEVFFGTDRGLCSYMSDATEPAEEMTKDNVYAYPNPVTPDYDGLITIVGLTLDADVKIVGPAGTLVKSGRSNGGTFVWDGTDSKGRRVASGVYMVETATSDGSKGTVCKIGVVR